jgi:hypothetical protein
MKKFRLDFYIPDIKDGSHVDDAIGNYTLLLNRIGSVATLDFDRLKVLKRLYSSHVELHTPDENGYYGFGGVNRIKQSRCVGTNGNVRFYGNCWTSTMGQLGGKDRKGSGVCCRPASEVFKNPERWFYCEFEVSDFGYKQMTDMMQVELEANKGYDKSMIARFFVPMPIIRIVQKIKPNFCNDKLKWICSEFCNHHALIAFQYSKMQSIDPVIYKDNPTYQIAVQKIINDTMSPLLSATSLHYHGVDFYNMDGSLLLAGKK